MKKKESQKAQSELELKYGIASISLDITRTLLFHAQANDQSRFLGFIRPSSKLTKSLKRDLDKYWKEYHKTERQLHEKERITESPDT